MRLLTIVLISSLIFFGCKPKDVVIDYEEIKNEVLHDSSTTVSISDSADIFDQDFYDPETTEFVVIMDSLEYYYEKDSAWVKSKGIQDSSILSDDEFFNEKISNPTDSFSANIDSINIEELKALKYNLRQLHAQDSLPQLMEGFEPERIDYRVWAEISKTDQRMYLHIDGQLVDTFKVSTGSTKHETPLFDQRPNGPIFQKYTSKKYPGGNYNGLGNMPYAVFIRGGYAVHGTTRGNIPRLGKKASHGCIRMHPDDAKIFNELVRKAGLNNTWISVEE